jgi:hypothetical protein
MSSRPPKLGPPAYYIYVIWLAAFASDPQEYYDELDEERCSIRCIRLYRDGSYKAFSYDSPNWRDVMPEAAIDEPDVINRDSQFRARAITREEFEIAWDAAHPENPLRFNIIDDGGQILCPCCGLAGQFSYPPYETHGGSIGCGICACCMWEPGFDDDTMASAHAKPSIKASLDAYRAVWIEQGYPWRTKPWRDNGRPENWDGRAQCDELLRRFPHLQA